MLVDRVVDQAHALLDSTSEPDPDAPRHAPLVFSFSLSNMSRSSAATDDLSLPPMTRAPSSAQGSDVLPTPQDDLISLNMPHGKERVDSTAYSEPPRIHDIFVRDAPYASTARGLVPPQFASPRHEWRSYSSGDAGPNHTRTTRDLISLYEQNRSALDLSPPRVNPYAMNARRNRPMPTMPLSTYPKHRMPIRESFRNLLSAFGMKKERKEDIGAGPYIPAPVRRDDVDAQDALRLELPPDPDDDVRVRSSETVETFSVRGGKTTPPCALAEDTTDCARRPGSASQYRRHPSALASMRRDAARLSPQSHLVGPGRTSEPQGYGPLALHERQVRSRECH